MIPLARLSGDDDGQDKPPRSLRWGPWAALALAGLFYATIVLRPWSGRAPLATGRLSVKPLPGAPSRLALEGESSRDGYVVVVGLRAPGQVHLYLPPGDEAPREVEAGKPRLLGEIELPSGPGQERLLGVFCHVRLPKETIQKAAERALQAAGSPEATRTLDLGCAEAWADPPPGGAPGVEATGPGN